MIHIKRFNESYLDYYQEINHDEYQKMIGVIGVRMGANIEEMTDDEKSQIKELLHRKGFMDRLLVNLPDTSKYEFDKKIVTGKHQLVIDWVNSDENFSIIVNKVKDEWFLAAHHNMRRIEGKSYKCDQLDGLLEFLEDKLPNKHEN
jgi:hypothetical protein